MVGMPWHPREERPDLLLLPEGMVAFGRPPAPRFAYLQWEEGDIAPQVVFYALTTDQTDAEFYRDFELCEDRGVQEFYLYNEYESRVRGFWLHNTRLKVISDFSTWVSPALGVNVAQAMFRRAVLV
jgi:Uma2 family endonuclease